MNKKILNKQYFTVLDLQVGICGLEFPGAQERWISVWYECEFVKGGTLIGTKQHFRGPEFPGAQMHD